MAIDFHFFQQSCGILLSIFIFFNSLVEYGYRFSLFSTVLLEYGYRFSLFSMTESIGKVAAEVIWKHMAEMVVKYSAESIRLYLAESIGKDWAEFAIGLEPKTHTLAYTLVQQNILCVRAHARAQLVLHFRHFRNK